MEKGVVSKKLKPLPESPTEESFLLIQMNCRLRFFAIPRKDAEKNKV